MSKKYYKSRELLLAACALVHTGAFAKAGKCLMQASQMPDFEEMVEDLNTQQQQAMPQQQQVEDQQLSALASIVEGMSEGVNDMDDLLEDLDYEPGDEPVEEEVDVDLAPPVDGVDVDVADDQVEEPQMATAATRLARAEANLKKLTKK